MARAASMLAFLAVGLLMPSLAKVDELHEEVLHQDSECPAGNSDCALTLLQLRGAGDESDAAKGGAADAEGAAIIPYPTGYCTKCGEMAFCHRAGNPGCGGLSTDGGGVATFPNRAGSKGCGQRLPLLTIPRSYVRDINGLSQMYWGQNILTKMLTAGFFAYQRSGYSGPVMQCVHKGNSVSVRWLHLHSFCAKGRVDNLPSRAGYCALMDSPADAPRIAASWIR
eukprot:TRINITY_DN22350_c0_g2_i1.p1 TRINITY_DN22350_c0_g2~~TRINITY_DN22350_c0_g2_i1.p1  ORF type:complete len:225 (-),score=31.38 TRINITY_DN22350_c0_g2_i1:280-954(-)